MTNNGIDKKFDEVIKKAKKEVGEEQVNERLAQLSHETKNILEILKNGPTRIVISSDGYAVPSQKATDIKIDIIFIRNDNWSLGAPSEFETVAYNMWPEDWVAFIQNGEVRDISEYKG